MNSDLLHILKQPASAARLSGSGWTNLFRTARQSKAMSKLAHRLAKADIASSLDWRINDHLTAAHVVARQHQRVVKWEANRIMAALADEPYDVVFLKGGAYVLASLEAGQGRLVSDIDIMVPKDHVFRAEQKLLDAGWAHIKLDAYDQRYYRQWMHELPPLRHAQRKNVLDLHHTILPETGRLKPDPRKLFASAIVIPGQNNPRAKMLCPIDMILHSAAHLFQDGDLAGGLRDLLDLDDLLREFAASDKTFWAGLIPRARELDLARPLFYALRFTHALLDTPVPDDVLAASQTDGPGGITRSIMDKLMRRALTPDDLTTGVGASDLSRWLLYVRSHWLRMPPWLLAQHLSRKAVAKMGIAEEAQPQTQAQANIRDKRAA